MRYCFDIDGTICTTDCDYREAKPYQEVTWEQIENWGVKYHELKLGKPAYDLFVDDKAISNLEWYKKENIKI